MSDPAPERCEFDERAMIVRADLTIAADVRAIDGVAKRVMALVEEMGCARGNEFEIETAVREALANAIIHGCEEDPSKTVGVSVGCDAEHGMILVVRDTGEGFDPSLLPNPCKGEHLYSESGRGIYLINQLMDEVRIRSTGGTEIWMRKQARQAAEPNDDG